MTRIAFVSANPKWGGSEMLWSQAAARLARDGLDVTAVVHHELTAHDQVFDLRRSGVDVVVHSEPSIRKGIRRRLSPGRARIALDLDDAFGGFTPSLVVLSTGSCFLPIEFIETCIEKRWPFVTIAQANYEGWWPDDERARRYREALPLARRCYFVSFGNLRLAEKQLGCEIENSEVVRDPFNVRYDASPAWPSFDGMELRLACVGRLHPESKGQDILLEALAHPDWSTRPWRLTFYGDLPWRDGLERLAARLGLGNRVRFAGHVPDIEQVWTENHALVMPSRFEGLPLAMVEAMLCGRAVVTTDIAGHREIVDDGVTGFIADAPTPLSVRRALERMWVRRADLQSMGAIAAQSIRDKVPHDPIKIFADKIVALCGG